MLRTRLYLYLAPFVVVLLAIGAYAIILFSRLATHVDTEVTQSFRSVTAADIMRAALTVMDREANEGTLSSDAGMRLFAPERTRFEQNLVTLTNNAVLRGEPAQVRELLGHYRSFLAAVNEQVSPARVASPRDVYEQRIVPRTRKIEEILRTIRVQNEQALLSIRPDIEQSVNQVSMWMIIGLLAALAVSGYASYRLSRSILQPIQNLTDATRELGEGKLERKVPVQSRNELGQLAGAFNKMAEQLQEYRQSTSDKIVRLHRTMESTLASFPDPIFVLNRDGGIELQNPAAASLASGIGVDKQLPGRIEVIAQKTLDEGRDFLPDSFDEVLTFRAGGVEKFFLPRVLAMHDKHKALFGVAVVLYDVTRFRLLDAAKTNLVATVSHELKTPLTSVRMTLHIMLERLLGPLAPKQEELLQAARNDTERLLRILNDLLDLARLDEGIEELRREPVHPADLLQSAIEQTNEDARAKGLKLACSVDPDLPKVAVDRQRIGHVFANFINNAIKHSPVPGQIRLRASMAEDNDVQFSVSDHGPGIPEEYQARIFDRFFRVPGQARTGAGLGLSIAREITVAHGGRIGVKSTPGQGSTFYVVLKAANGGAARV